MASNPNGANGTTKDPREQTCWDLYVESIAQGRENAYQSAIEAGYEESSAKKITVTRWFTERKEKLRRRDILSKAERVLEKTLEMKVETDEGKIQPDLLRIQTDVAKFYAKTQGKDDGYSERTELTQKDGKDLPTPILQNVFSNDSTEENSQSQEEN